MVSTVAGTSQSALASVCGSSNGVGTAASFCSIASNLAVDTALALYIADNSYNIIRKITSSGVVSTFAGSGASSSIDGIGTAATIWSPRGICLDSTGNLFVSETGSNYKIRKIIIATGILYIGSLIFCAIF